MIDLYLKSFGLFNPTVVEYNNNGRMERLESRRLDMHDLVLFWKKGFDLNIAFGEKIILHCSSKDYNAMNQRTTAISKSVVELFYQQGVKCIVDDEWFEEVPFDKMDKAELTYRVKQEVAEGIISDLKNYIAEYGHITRSMLNKLIERYTFNYGVEFEDDE